MDNSHQSHWALDRSGLLGHTLTMAPLPGKQMAFPDAPRRPLSLA